MSLCGFTFVFSGFCLRNVFLKFINIFICFFFLFLLTLSVFSFLSSISIEKSQKNFNLRGKHFAKENFRAPA